MQNFCNAVTVKRNTAQHSAGFKPLLLVSGAKGQEKMFELATTVHKDATLKYQRNRRCIIKLTTFGMVKRAADKLYDSRPC